jgi:hypothetical protein
MYEYSYTKSDVYCGILHSEILAEPTLSGLGYVLFTKPDDLNIIFNSELSSQEEATLSGIIENHPTSLPGDDPDSIDTGNIDSGYILVSDGEGGTDWSEIGSTARGVSDVIYLTYDGVNGTQSGEKGCTLTSSGSWTITKLNAVYYLDSNLGALTITIPDVDSGNVNSELFFRKPGLMTESNSIILQTESGQDIGPSDSFYFEKPGSFATLVANNFGSGGLPNYRWRQVTDDKGIVNYIDVAESGGDYSDLQQAIDSAEDGNVINIHPGTYIGNFVVDKDIILRGDNTTNCILTSYSGTTLTLNGTDSIALDELSVRSQPVGIPGCHAIRSVSSAINYIDSCHVFMMTTATYGDAIYVDGGGTFRVSGSALQYFNIVAGGGTHSLINTINGSISFRDSSTSVHTSANSYDYYFTIYNNANDSEIKAYTSQAIMNATSSGFGGIMTFMRNNASSGIIYSAHNLIEVTGPGSVGTGYAYSATDGTTIRSTGNRVTVSDFENNYFANTWNTGTLISHFDDIDAEDGVVGNGTYNFVNSPSNGNMQVSGAYKSIFDRKLVVALRGGDYDNIYDAINQVKTTGSGTDKYAIEIEPGEYTLSGTVTIDTPYLVTIAGYSTDSVRFKPLNSSVNTLFDIQYNTALLDFGIDATNVPSMETASGTIGIQVNDDSYEEIYFENIDIRGVRYGLYSDIESNIYMRGCDIRRCGTAIRLDGDYLLFDADALFVEDCWDKHIHVSNGEAYFADAEFCSTNTLSGTALYVEGDGTHVELFGGTNIWGVEKNIVVKDSAVLLIDNSVIEDSAVNPGIEQKDTSTLRIVNSRAPLSNDSLDIQDPTNVYINAYDSDDNYTTIGTGDDEDQIIFTVETGKLTKPKLRYTADYYGYKGLIYENPTDGEESILGVEAVNEKAELTCISKGSNAWNYGTYFNLYSDQNGSLRGWEIGKGTGSTPPVTFKYQGSLLAFQLNYDGTVQFNSGVNVNKVLDEDTMNSDDRYALATQQSIKAYVDNTTYSQTDLDSGTLNDLYYTETEVDSISGSITNQMLYKDGSVPLTNDWNAGDYTITAGGFKKDNANVDLAVYADTTGILTGGTLSINAINSYMLDVISGTSIYVDMSDPGDPVVETLSWPTQSISGSLNGDFYKWIGVYRVSSGVGGLIIDNDFSALERRSTAVLGKYWSTISGSDEITNIANYTTAAYCAAKTLEDFIDSYGAVNITGNRYSVSTITPMTLRRTAGKAFRKGANRTNQPTSPNIYESTADNSISSYYYQISNSYRYTEKSEIDPNYYDVGGVLTPVPTGKWTVQRIYYFAVSDVTVVLWGQHCYDSLSLAYDGISSDNFDLLTGSVEGAVLRAYLIVKRGATDLTDLDQAIVYTAYGRDGVLPGLSNHGDLGGLANDDHIQYHNDFRGDSRYYTQTQVDYLLTTLSGNVTISGNLDHGLLMGLQDDDHFQYVLVSGTRPFTGIVGYDSHKTFTSTTDIVDKKYVDDALSSFSPDHGDLSGLDDDDHNQYSLSNGTRAYTGKVSYSSHPTFTNTTELVDKKYVDDEISGLTTDHGELTGLGDDDHSQYHNDTRGDARYYTQTQVDAWITNHTAAGSTDHDNRYYTETEVDNLLTSVSGALADQIDAIETGDLPACQIRRTTDFTFPGSWGDVTFDTTDFENDTDVLEHDDSNTERINIKETGLYFITYKFQVIRSSSNYSYSRILKNGSTVLDGSESEVNTYTNEEHELTGSFIISLQQNDYITLQAYENTSGSTTGTDDTILTIISLKGLRGEQGPAGQNGQPGVGATINISQDGSIEASSVSNLNFEGNVTVTSGVSYTTVTVGAPKTIQCYSTNTTNVNSSTPVAVGWNQEDLKDDDYFTHDNSTNNSRVYVDQNGWYEVSYNLYYDGASGRSNVRGRIRKNGSDYLGRGTSTNYTRNTTEDSGSIGAGPFLIQLSTNDYLELVCDQQGSSTTCSMVASDNYIRLTYFRSS